MNTFTMPNEYCGRIRLYSNLTDKDLNDSDGAEKLKTELIEWILPRHIVNRERELFLMQYYCGYHPNIMTREKVIRPDVNNKIAINYGKSFTRDIVSYLLGKPVQYVKREDEYGEAIKKLGDALDAESKDMVDFQIATNMSVCGVGYRGVFAEKEPTNGTHMKIVSLEPWDTFVVWSPDKAVGQVYCGTFYVTPPEPNTLTCKIVLTVYTRMKKYVFESEGAYESFSVTGLELVEESDSYLGGNFPIIEYPNSVMMIGDWESEIGIMDAIDKLNSDDLNDIEQFVNSILLAQGFEMDEETMEQLEVNKVLNVKDVPPGVNVVVKYIAEQVSADNVSSLRDWLESTMRVVVGVPDRKQRGGGGADTGDAVYLRDGWQDIDLVAAAKEKFFIDADRKSLATMLYIMNTFGEIEDVQAKDVAIKFSRTKQANLQAKAQAYSTLVGAAAPIAPQDALEFSDLTNNVQDVIMRSEEFSRQKMEEAAKAQQAFMNNQGAATTQSSSDSGQNNQGKTSTGDGKEGDESNS